MKRLYSKDIIIIWISLSTNISIEWRIFCSVVLAQLCAKCAANSYCMKNRFTHKSILKYIFTHLLFETNKRQNKAKVNSVFINDFNINNGHLLCRWESSSWRPWRVTKKVFNYTKNKQIIWRGIHQELYYRWKRKLN